MDLGEIKRPTLILDPEKVRKNIERIAGRIEEGKTIFRPHFKTHQSAEVGEWFKEFGVSAITVSSVQMAGYFSQHGWKDITIAFPFNKLEIREVNRLAREVNLNLLVESDDIIEFLDKEINQPVKIWIKIDTGYHRAGISWKDTDQIAMLVKKIKQSQLLDFKGILTHAGHSYDAGCRDEIKLIHQESVARMTELRFELAALGIDNVEISIGDTPGCSTAEEFCDVDEIRCGNMVFYDVMQLYLAACRKEDIAIALACPVVAIHPKRNEFVVYGGAVHLSKDYVLDSENRKIYGLMAFPGKMGWGSVEKETFVRSLSQEHGVIKTVPRVLNRLKIGDIVMVLPVHSCLTANLMKGYRTPSGDFISTASY